MNTEDILNKVKTIITSVANVQTGVSIRGNQKLLDYLPTDTYIDSLAVQVKKTFPKVDSTDLVNAINKNSIVTIFDLVQTIKQA